MNKQEMIDVIVSSANITKAAAENTFNAFIEAITKSLVDGNKVSIPNVGTLETAQRAARVGKNPRTGETINIPASSAVKFKAAKRLKDAVNA